MYEFCGFSGTTTCRRLPFVYRFGLRSAPFACQDSSTKESPKESQMISGAEARDFLSIEVGHVPATICRKAVPHESAMFLQNLRKNCQECFCHRSKLMT